MALTIAYPWTASTPTILPAIQRPNYDFSDTINVTADPAAFPKDLISSITVTRAIAGETLDDDGNTTSEQRSISLPTVTTTFGTSHTDGTNTGYEDATITFSGKYGDPFLDTFKLVDVGKGFFERRGGSTGLSARDVYNNQLYEKFRGQSTFQENANIVRGFDQLPDVDKEDLFSLEQDMTSKIVVTHTVTINYDKWTATDTISTTPAEINQTETILITHDINNNFGAISTLLRERHKQS